MTETLWKKVFDGNYLENGLPDGSRVKNQDCNAGDTGDGVQSCWKIPWRKWQLHLVFLPGKSWRTEEPRASHSPWGCKRGDTTE